mgnify:FL=1
MGTRMDVVITGQSDQVASSAITAIREVAERWEYMLSNYNADSEVSRINRLAAGEPLEVSDRMRSVLNSIIGYYHRTKGFFNPFMGGVTGPSGEKKRAKQTRGSNLDPEHTLDPEPADASRITSSGPGDLREVRKHYPGPEGMEIINKTVRFIDERIQLDMGGFGKGLALYEIDKVLKTSEINSAFISFGESTILGVGTHPFGDYWKVGIQHPQKEGKIVHTVYLRDQAVSVSGNTRNNASKSRQQGHIWDPQSNTFISRSSLVWVTSDNPLDAEVFSTALFAAGQENTSLLLEEEPGIEAGWIDETKQMN